MLTTADQIDREAREVAQGRVTDLQLKIGEVESILAWFAGFVDKRSLGASAVGTIGIKAGEMREQLPALRQAIRDLDPSCRG